MSKKKVLILFLIISFSIFVLIFLINLFGAKVSVVDALKNAGMFSLPLILLGGCTGIPIMFRKDVDDAIEKGDTDDINVANWYNKFKGQ